MRSQSTLRARALLRALATATLLVSAPAFAEEPAKPATTTTATTPTTAPAPAEADKSSESRDARPAQGGLTASEVERAFKRYRKQVRNGNTVYCRSEKPVGTRIGKQICYSEDQVIATARAERDARDQMSQMNVCGAGSCSPGS